MKPVQPQTTLPTIITPSALSFGHAAATDEVAEELAACLDLLDAAVATVTRCGGFRPLNQRARECRALALHARRLHTLRPRLVILEDDTGEPEFIVQCRPIRTAGEARTLVLAARAADDTLMPSAGVLADCFGLTLTEARVACLLSAGRAPQEVAMALGIGYQTVRGHLKQCFLKTDTQRQAHLVSRILSKLSIRLR